MTDRLTERGIDRWMCALLAVQWLVMLMLARPLGGAEFAINDDWAQQQAMAALVHQGRLVIPDWTATNFIGQLVWAAPWAWLGGPSFEVLRCSGLAAGLIGVWGFYGVLRQMNASATLSGAVAALFAAHPIYLALSASFMTDVPFLALSLLALWCMLRYHRHAQPLDLAGALVFASWALLTRQTGVALFIGFALAHGLQPRAGAVKRAAAVLAWGLLLLWAYPAVLEAGQRLPAMRDAASMQVAETLALPWDGALRSASSWLVFLLLYLGMGAALPLLVIAALRWHGADRRKLRLWLTFAGLALLLGWWISGIEAFRMPLLGNDWSESGLGQRLHVGKVSAQRDMLWHFWTVLTIAALAGTVVALGVLVRMSRRRLQAGGLRHADHFAFTLMAAALVLQWAPALLLTSVYDRYALPLLAPFLALLVWAGAGKAQLPQRAAAWTHAGLGAVIAAASLLAAALLHDYFAWNRARWDWLKELPATLGVAPTQIQGGFEYSAQLRYQGGRVAPGPHGWFLEPQPYQISMGPLSGRELMQVRRVQVWLPFSPAEVWLTRAAW